MNYKCAVAIVRTKTKNIDRSFMVATNAYIKAYPNRYKYHDCYTCDNFNIAEFMDGDIFITMESNLTKATVEQSIVVKDCYRIEIYIQEPMQN